MQQPNGKMLFIAIHVCVWMCLYVYVLVTNYKSVTSKVFNRENSKWFSTKIPVHIQLHLGTVHKHSRNKILNKVLSSSHTHSHSLSLHSPLSIPSISFRNGVALAYSFASVSGTFWRLSRCAFNGTPVIIWNKSTLKPSILSLSLNTTQQQKHTHKHIQYALIKFHHGRVLLCDCISSLVLVHWWWLFLMYIKMVQKKTSHSY